MTDYSFVPDRVLLNMARHSAREVADWERALNRAKQDVVRAEGALAHWQSERDDQYHALDERDIPAPDGQA